MKKIAFSLAILFAIVFVSCQKELDFPPMPTEKPADVEKLIPYLNYYGFSMGSPIVNGQIDTFLLANTISDNKPDEILDNLNSSITVPLKTRPMRGYFKVEFKRNNLILASENFSAYNKTFRPRSSLRQTSHSFGSRDTIMRNDWYWGSGMGRMISLFHDTAKYHYDTAYYCKIHMRTVLVDHAGQQTAVPELSGYAFASKEAYQDELDWTSLTWDEYFTPFLKQGDSIIVRIPKWR